MSGPTHLLDLARSIVAWAAVDPFEKYQPGTHVEVIDAMLIPVDTNDVGIITRTQKRGLFRVHLEVKSAKYGILIDVPLKSLRHISQKDYERRLIQTASTDKSVNAESPSPHIRTNPYL